MFSPAAGYPLPPSSAGGDDDYDSAEEEERMRELEHHLYSMVHYADNVDDVAQKVEEGREGPEGECFTIDEKGEEVDLAALDSGVNSLSPSPAQGEAVEAGDRGAKSSEVVINNNLEDTKVVNNTQSTLDLSSDSDDDGIQVLETPTVVMPPKKGYQESVVVTVSEDSDESSDDDSPVRRKKAKLSPPVPSSETPKQAEGAIKDKAPSSVIHSTPAARLIVEHPSSEEATPRRKKAIPTYELASDSDTDSSLSALSDDSDDAAVPVLGTPVLNLNVTGERRGAGGGLGVQRSLFRILGHDASVAPPSQQLRYPGWTEEMLRFYNEADPANADVTLEAIKAGMSNDPDDWRLRPQDRGGDRRGSGRYFNGGGGYNPRCHNCNEFGHVRRDCPEPERPPTCCICGVKGHRMATCPSSLCVQCGKPGPMYDFNCAECKRRRSTRCGVCGTQGHPAWDCTDNWRRFHLTTEKTPSGELPAPAEPDHEVHRPEQESTCSNCGRLGHFTFQCPRHRNGKMARFAPVNLVCSYDGPTAVPAKFLSKRQEKKEAKEAKKMLREKKKLGGAGAEKRTEERKSLEYVRAFANGDDLASDLLASGRTKMQEKRSLQRLKKKVFRDESRDAGQLLAQNKIRLRQRGFIARGERRPSSGHIRFEEEEEKKGRSPVATPGSGKKKKNKNKEAGGKATPTTRTPGKRGSLTSPGEPPKCQKSTQSVIKVLKKEIRRCKGTPKARGARSRASEELDYLQSMNSSAVPKRDRKRLGSLIKELERF